MGNQQDVQHNKSDNGEQPMEHSQNPSTEIWDKPEGAENVQSNNQVFNILSAVPIGIKPGAVYRYFGPFPTRPEKIFHIDHNGQVKMGLPLNMKDFHMEVTTSKIVIMITIHQKLLINFVTIKFH